MKGTNMSKNQLIVRICSYSFDIEYNRDNSNCNCDYICRCSKLTNVKIASKPNISAFSFEYKKSNTESSYKFTELEEYCIERILTYLKYFDLSKYEVDVCNSYYGEEVSGVSFDNYSVLEKYVKEMLEKNSPLKQLMYVLDLEYSFIPKNLESVNILEVKELDISDIESSIGQLQLIKRNNDVIYDSNSDIRGVIFHAYGKYNLVDGHHRLQFDLCSNNKTNKYIILK